jgi:hypothetical protein
MNKDVLMDNDEIDRNYENYQTPLKVLSKYSGLQSLDDLTKSHDKMPVGPIT